MNYERIELGSAPFDEPCAQVGSLGYYEKAQRECKAFRNQLVRMLEAQGYDTGLVSLYTKGNNHDFGSYYDVAVKYDADNEKACEVAYWLDANVPGEWDQVAREELAVQ